MRIVSLRDLALLSVAFAWPAMPCYAAFLSTYGNAGVHGAGSDPRDGIIRDTNVGGRSVSVASSFSAPGGSAEASASADARTGKLTSFGLKNGGAGDAEGAAYAASSFTASKSGSVDFYFDLSGAWDVQDAPGLDYENRLYQEAIMEITSNGGTHYEQHIVDTAYDADFNPPDLPPTGTTSRRLKYTAVVQSGTAYSLTGYVYTWLSGVAYGSGTLDGVLSYVAHDGVALTFDDPRFLVAPVPLPAGGLLLLGGLGAALLGVRGARPGGPISLTL
ncbi:hypothetical protein [Amaricoccus sp.]|uniref:hypothetical protein n=1 Tax=Amaricoccus sp. TaxID=1872485 RepID=UPI001B7B7CB3|nr:hypothetical protein [Amaricoccus sp.]MBP7001878.1 hypothetical protein [Amaricoccus sp.]